MDGRKFQFLRAVLGDDGAQALAKAAERAPELGTALLPRTIMAWLGVASRADFEGAIPGVPDSYLQFAKTEDRYSGAVSVGDEVYSFEAATVLHLGACMAVAIGSDHERMSPVLRDLDIQRLGKNIDTLVKARIAVAELRKMKPLMKMALIHDNRQEPKTVYRLQNDRDQGPYDGLGGRSMNRLVPKTNDVSPEDDFSPDEMGALNGHPQPYFAFEHPDHAKQWFGEDGLRKLAAKGYTLRPRLAAKVWRSKSGKQVMFHPADASVVKGEKKPQGGAEAPGPAHAATPPLAPLAPQAPIPTQTSRGPTVGLHPRPPKLPTPKAATDQVQTGATAKQPKSKAPTLKVTKAEAEASCPVCAGKQFRADRFEGCVCFRALAKGVTVEPLADGYNLEFGRDWDQEAILTLIESFGRK